MSIDLSGYVTEEVEVKLGNKKFWFSPLTLTDLGLMRKRIKEQRKANNKQRREEIFVEAKEVGSIDALELLKYLDRPLTEAEIEEMMEAFEGISYMCFLSLKHHYKDITEDEAASLITQNDLLAVVEALNSEEEEPGIIVTMEQLGKKVELKDGRTLTISEILGEVSKKKRNRKPVKKRK